MKTSVRICIGSDCRKRKKSNAEILALLGPHCRVETMKCQDFCKGPVVRVRHGNQRTWFQKLRGKKLRSDLLHYVIEGELSPRLKKSRVRQKK